MKSFFSLKGYKGGEGVVKSSSLSACTLGMISNRCVTRGGRGEVFPKLFQKLEKSALIWEKNALIVVIYG